MRYYIKNNADGQYTDALLNKASKYQNAILEDWIVFSCRLDISGKKDIAKIIGNSNRLKRFFLLRGLKIDHKNYHHVGQEIVDSYVLTQFDNAVSNLDIYTEMISINSNINLTIKYKVY